MLNDIMSISRTNRILDLERISQGSVIEGDFDGSVTGFWEKLDADGAGVVKYKEKTYKTQIIGTASIPSGTAVELSHANGIYYSKY